MCMGTGVVPPGSRRVRFVVRVLGFLAIAFVTLAFAGIAAPAKPVTAQETVAPCAAELAAVEAAVLAADSLRAKDEAGLLDKVASAGRKVAEDKPGDAVAALTGIVTKAEALIAGGKVDLAQGRAILAATDAAVTCIQPPTATT